MFRAKWLKLYVVLTLYSSPGTYLTSIVEWLSQTIIHFLIKTPNLSLFYITYFILDMVPLKSQIITHLKRLKAKENEPRSQKVLFAVSIVDALKH